MDIDFAWHWRCDIGGVIGGQNDKASGAVGATLHRGGIIDILVASESIFNKGGATIVHV